MTARNRVATVLFILAALLAALYAVIGVPLWQARSAWRDGRVADAIASLETWRRLRLRPAEFDHLLAVAYLTAGQREAAEPLLRGRIERHREMFPLVAKDEVAATLVGAGRYDEFLFYDAVYKGAEGDRDLLNLYRAAAAAGSWRLDDAASYLRAVDREEVNARMFAAVAATIEHRRRGVSPFLLDRRGRTIAEYHHANRDLVAVNTDFHPLVDKRFGADTVESHLHEMDGATIETTLDAGIQRAALRALGSYRGSLVAIDVARNELIAIASSSGGAPPANLALSAQYEPGSIIKILTVLNAYDHGKPPESFFPLECEGFVPIEGRQFFDWAVHGHVSDLAEATAVSCNVAFAKIGLSLGREKLESFVDRARFDSRANVGLYDAPLGRQRGALSNGFAVANMAIGLEHLSVNALHIAMLATAIARGGVIDDPILVRRRRSIVGLSLPFTAGPRRNERLCTPEAAARVIPIMEAVIANPRGTGRRAAVPGLRIAMKTGTAGQGEAGYDALIMAFAPAEAPRIAVGIIAEHAGPAEFAGARIAHDFFAAVAPILAAGAQRREPAVAGRQ